MKYAVSDFFMSMTGFIIHDICEAFLNLVFVFGTNQSITSFFFQIRKLDDSEFRNAFSRAYIRVFDLIISSFL